MRYLMWTAIAAGVMFTSNTASWANDVIRLGGQSAQLSIEGGTDTELVRWGYRGGYGGYGGYRGGYYGGYRGGYYGGGYGYGGYRGGYYGGYYGGYRGGYYGGGYGYYGGYRPYYNNYYYGSYYRPHYYNRYYRIVADPCDVVPNVTLTYQPTYPQTITTQQYVQPIPSNTYGQPIVPNVNGNQTYPYDGGPKNPIPMPPAENTPANQDGPRGIIPLDGKLVSMPLTTSVGMSPVVAPDLNRWTYVSTTNVPAQAKTSTTRIVYPAYGEQTLPKAPRATIIR